MIIHHVNGKNCLKHLEGYTGIVYQKQWYLEHTFQDKLGRNIQFRGWINTYALNPHDFPDTLEGTFWVSKVEENGYVYDGLAIATLGYFDIGFGYSGFNYITGSVYPIYFSEGLDENVHSHGLCRELQMKADRPLNRFERFEANIQDCLVPNRAYIHEMKI